MERLKPYSELSVEEVSKLLDQGGLTVIDTNPRRRWLSGHVPSAINLDPADYTEDELPSDKAAAVLFYCSDPSCGACHRAAQKAVEMGFRQVFTMPAGIRGWLAAGKPVERAS